MIPAFPASQRWLLPLLLLLAGLHATSAALIRPLYQVSDEVNYLAGVQTHALASAPPALAPCLAPPDGAPPAASLGGKALFHVSGAAVLTALCRNGAGDFAPIGLRILAASSLVVVVFCGWQVAALLAGGTLAPALTALALASQPVLAKYAGAISPDSPANACTAVAILCGVRWLVLGPSLLRFVGVLVASAAAAALKDAALFIIPVNGLMVLVSLFWLTWRQPRRSVWLVPGALVVLVAVPWLIYLTQTVYTLDRGVTRAMEAPLAFIGLVVADTLGRLPVFLGSAYWSLGGFGGTSAALPTTAAALAAGLWLAAAAGLWDAWRRAPSVPGAVLAYLGVLVVACLLQAPTRQVLTGMTDQHQGRWLFPVAVPVAVALASGLARVGGARGWPLVAVAQLTIMLSALASVVQFHVTSPAWALDRANLYLHSTGGLDIGVARTAEQVTRAWAAAAPPGPATLSLLSCVVCGALLLRCRPVPGTPHVHHADHR